MPRGVVCAGVAAAAAVALIAATMTAGAKPGISFSGASAYHGYGVFVALRCGDGCRSGAGVAAVELTAGRPPTAPGPCPYGTDALPPAPIVDGRFQTGRWLWIAPRRFVWMWLSGRLVAPGRLVGAIKGPPACGGRDRYALRLPASAG